VTLFMVVTSGVSWQQVYDPLTELGWMYPPFFIVYLCIVLFGVMNVVTSVFVESAVMSAQHYKDLIIQEKENARAIAVGHIKKVFRFIDADDSGIVTGEEVERFLEDPNLRQYVNALDINAEDARMLFRLLDRDGTQEVGIDEFCEGCLRLQGDAKSFDVHSMIFHMKSFLGKWGDFTVYVEERLSRLDAVLGIESEYVPRVSGVGSARRTSNRLPFDLAQQFFGNTSAPRRSCPAPRRSRSSSRTNSKSSIAGPRLHTMPTF